MSGTRTIRGNHCIVHGYHWPVPVRTVRHHIWPKEWGGPDVESNLVNVCDTGHYNIHAYMDAAFGGKPVPKITKRERLYAELGLKAYYESRKP
jgi:hypothetical protein